MNWTKTYDNNDNDVWEATSPYEEGFQWRLMQKLQDNKIVWYEAHDADLLDDPDWAEEFENLEAAKEFVEIQDKEIRTTLLEDLERDDLS